MVQMDGAVGGGDGVDLNEVVVMLGGVPELFL
jgi:hypothetical protein